MPICTDRPTFQYSGYGRGPAKILKSRPFVPGKSKVGKLVSRFRSSHHCAAVSFANFGIEGHYQLIDLVWLWLRSPHFGLANKNDADF
jgi:hypothetical protein